MHGKILSDPLSALQQDAPIAVPPSATAADAIRLMRENRHGSVAVIDQGRLAGIFTERDILMKIAGRGVDPARVEVSSVMTPSPAALSEDDPLAFAIHLMAVRGFRHIPVLRGGTPVGIVSIRGVLRHLTLKTS